MANAIETIKKYSTYLDEVYKMSSRTAILDTPNELVKETGVAGTVMVAKIALTGLGDYSRSTGFIDGDVTFEWESLKLSHDRGTSFSIDAMDDNETLGLAFGKLSSEFIRNEVTPEVDAIRFAQYAAKSGYTVTGATLTSATAVEAITTAETQMEENDVDLANGAVLFITPTVYGYIKDDKDHFSRTLIPSENPSRNFGTFDDMTVVRVPQKRFYTAITLNDGTEKSGFEKDSTNGKDINFMIIAQGAVVQVTKHAKLRIFDPDTNQKSDAWKVDYRIYHDAWVPDNKKPGVYCHHKA